MNSAERTPPVDIATGCRFSRDGWLYLAVVMDLYARNIVGWSMKPTLARELVLDAVVMAVWRRKPRQLVLVHSDQAPQYGSDDWRASARPTGWSQA